ncbi:MAG: IS607 family transposase [Peptococcaceae bacterium]|nr:IS607 family transposase [Peptococcaceae bacterium]
MYSPAEAAKRLGVCTKTIHRWDKAGRIKTICTATNQRRISGTEIKRLLRLQGGERLRCVVYARVSSQKQAAAGNLERQRERLVNAAQAQGYELVSVITEQSSGLNENRRGLRRLFRLVSKDQGDVVMVEFKDRLARFGYAYIQEALRFHGVEIELLEQQETRDATREMVQDMLAIVAVFAAKLYGARSKTFQQKVKQAMKEIALMTGDGSG